MRDPTFVILFALCVAEIATVLVQDSPLFQSVSFMMRLTGRLVRALVHSASHCGAFLVLSSGKK